MKKGSRTRLGVYVLRTMRNKGFRVVAPERNAKYAEKIAKEKNDTLKLDYPARTSDVPMEARCFHENSEYFKDFKTGTPKDELIVLEVPETIENEFGEEVDNEEGLIELENVEDVIFLINILRRDCADSRVGLMPYSKQLTAKELDRLEPLPNKDKSDLEKRRHMKVSRGGRIS